MHGLTAEASVTAALNALPTGLLKSPVGIAVSGGSDSLALLTLAQNWARIRNVSLIAMTVNHGLRAEAAREAAEVAAYCRQIDTAHQTLTLSGLPPQQAQLRRWRHAELAKALRSHGGCLLLTGHTADDQAETFLMRARQGSGWYGLAGMRAVSMAPVWPEGRGIFIGRPLLRARRQALRAWLAGKGLSWSDDPSNENTAYERVRMRQLLDANSGLFEQVSDLQAKIATLRMREDYAVAGWLRASVSFEQNAFIARDIMHLPPERAARALGHLIQFAAGSERPPRMESVQRLVKRLVSQAEFRGATLGGAQLKMKKGALHISPEGRQTGSEEANDGAWRLRALTAMLGATASEIDAAAGNESFLPDLVPIF